MPLSILEPILDRPFPATHLSVRVRLIRAHSPRTLPRLDSSRRVYDCFAALTEHDREVFLVCLLDTKQRIAGVQIVSVGTLDSSPVHPREVFKAAIVANAASIICVHNHPSGEAKPSREDYEITARLAKAGTLLGIPLLDHVVIGVDGFASFRDRGVL